MQTENAQSIQQNVAPEVLPVWKTGSSLSKYAKFGIWSGMSSVIGLEILGKKTNVNVIRASYLLAQAANITSQITKKLGFCVAYVSDVGYLVRRLWNLLHKLFDPVFSSLKEAFCDIFGAAGTFIYKNISEFLSGYNIGLESTYNKLATNIVSVVLCLGGAVLLLLGLEAYGTVKKINRVRPSYHIINTFVNNFYRVMWLSSYSYGCAAGLITNFFRLVVEKVFPILKPIFNHLRDAAKPIKVALEATFEAPIAGVKGGFDNAVTQFKKNITATRFVAVMLAGCTIYVAAKRFGVGY